MDRTDQGRKPRFLQGEPPTDTAIAAVIQTSSRRVIRTLRHLGYLEAGPAPVVDAQPELARTMAASVPQRMIFGERAGQAQGRNHGLIGSIVGGHMIHDPLPWCGPAISADHRQCHPRFIHEFQAVDVERLDGLTECGAEGLDAHCVPLRGVE